MYDFEAEDPKLDDQVSDKVRFSPDNIMPRLFPIKGNHICVYDIIKDDTKAVVAFFCSQESLMWMQ